MKLYFDLHTHTLASGHAYSTLTENIAAAKAQGLTAYGHSEHAESMPGSVSNLYFTNFRVIPKEVEGMRIVGGIEVNIVDIHGNLDVEEWILKGVDYAIASIHSVTMQFGTPEENLHAVITAMENPYIKILGHPEDCRYGLDFDILCQEANRTGTLLELNNTSLHPESVRPKGRESATAMLQACMRHNTRIIVNTDAHIASFVGDFENALGLLEELNFPESLVVNASPEGLEQILKKK